MIRMGIGFDAHRLVPGRRLVLGGVHIEHDHGLEGHSDADVLCHAIADALLGAIADGDIGIHFPDTDPKWKDASSLEILSRVMDRLKDRKACVVNVDSTIIAEQPRLAPYRDAMRVNIARVLQKKPECVSVKATTVEGLGPLGQEQGIAVMTVAVIEIH